MTQENKYQIVTTVFGKETRLPTLYTFDEAVDACMASNAAFERAGVKKSFSFTLAQ